MTDLLDDKIRRLVGEVVDEAPTSIRTPVDLDSDRGRGRDRRKVLVGAAAIVALLTLVGGMYAALRDSNGEKVELADSTPTGEVFQLPSIFDRQRTPVDELPDDVAASMGGGILASRSEVLTLDIDDSRRGPEANGATVWVVPFTTRRGACWRAVHPEFGSSSQGCVHLDNDDVSFGIAMNTSISSSEGATGTTSFFITSGLVLSDDIVEVVGGTLEDGVFAHPSDTDPTFVFSDGTTAKQSDTAKTDTPTTEATANYQLPSTFDRPRTAADQLPDRAGDLSSERVRGPNGEVEVNPDDSRLGIEAQGISVWVVPSVDRRGACWFGTTGPDSFASSCAHLDNPLHLGVGWIGTQFNDGSGQSFGVIFNPEIVGVVGGTLKDGVYVHPSEREPIFIFRDGTASKLFEQVQAETTDVDQVVTFCQQVAQLDGERPSSYVGSAEHAADIQALANVAPTAVVADVERYQEYLTSGAIDSLADPDSNEFEYWPADVQSAVLGIQDFAASNC